MRARTGILAIGIAVVGVASTYLAVGRRPCLTWGATDEDVARKMPGDDILVNPDLLSTRAISIDAPPSAIWPWLVQMGTGKGGVYTYDWIENLFGLHMHSTDEILPQFQNRKVGDIEQLGSKGPRLRVDILDAERAMVLHSEDGNWVWAFCLYPTADGQTTLVSRNRIANPGASPVTRLFYVLVMEPGSLIMERKMLLGIRQRAEKLASRMMGQGIRGDETMPTATSRQIEANPSHSRRWGHPHPTLQSAAARRSRSARPVRRNQSIAGLALAANPASSIRRRMFAQSSGSVMKTSPQP